MPSWLSITDVPLFVSHRRLLKYKRLPRAKGIWALDSGGFTELSMYGKWTINPLEYATAVERYSEEIGGLKWAAQQDWMCEPAIREKTGRATEYHQQKTIENLHLLRLYQPKINWMPVLQGWKRDDYYRHIEMWVASGIEPKLEPIMGLGSVCRRQHTKEIEDLILDLSMYGIKLHSFGMKASGLYYTSVVLASTDSMAWSFTARYDEPLPGHTHNNCANCLEYALKWRKKVIDSYSSGS